MSRYSRPAFRFANRIVASIGVHSGKQPLFSVEKRKVLIAESCDVAIGRLEG